MNIKKNKNHTSMSHIQSNFVSTLNGTQINNTNRSKNSGEQKEKNNGNQNQSMDDIGQISLWMSGNQELWQK